MRVRPLVQAPLAASLEFEMLRRVGDEHSFAVDAGFGDRLVENAPGRTDKWLAGDVLFVAGLFTDHHQPRLRWAFARHPLRGVPVERAAGGCGPGPPGGR